MFVPHVGIFIQRDPLPQNEAFLVYSDEIVTALHTQQDDTDAVEFASKNLYEYANASPATFTDPTGLFPCGLDFCIATGTYLRIERIPGSRWWWPPHLKWRCVYSLTAIAVACCRGCTCPMRVGGIEYGPPAHGPIPGLLICLPRTLPTRACV